MPILFDPWERKGVYSDSLPTPTDSSSVENGDYIINIHNGKESYKPYSGGSSELPEVTAADNGDVLTVVSGEWAKATPSGGGGALIVTATDGTLDKTWQEIHDAAPLVWEVKRGYLYSPMRAVAEFDGEYLVSFFAPTQEGNVEFIDYAATSADGYPVLQQD